MQSRLEQIVVVGGGRAGVAAAEQLRWSGYQGELVVLHDENGVPYDRPACAKGLLTGHKRPQDAKLPIADGTDADWMLGRRAVHLDTAAQMVITDTDETFEYDGLVIASGAHPVAPPGFPIGEPGVHLLYRLSDAWALRADLRDAQRVAVIGGGLTGCEVVSAVRGMARECVLVHSKEYALTGPLGDWAGQMMTHQMAKDGVELRMGRRVSQIYRARRGWALLLDDGEEIFADVVVASTGERPDTSWLSGTPDLDLSDGVLCDEALRVVGADNVVAAGTVARWPNLQYSAKPKRVGQWIAALEHGRAAAKTLLAGDRPVDPVIHVPRFWSDQFGVRIQAMGVLPGDADISITEMKPGRRDVARSGVLIGYYTEGELVGMVAINAPHAFTAMTRAILATSRPRFQPVPAVAPAARPFLAAVS